MIIVNQINFNKAKYSGIFTLNLTITFNKTRISLFKLKSFKKIKNSDFVWHLRLNS